MNETIGSVLDQVISEALNPDRVNLQQRGLAEKDVQVASSPPEEENGDELNLYKNDDNGEKQIDMEKTSANTRDDIKAMKFAPTFEQAVDVMNFMRSGHSLRDKYINVAMKNYYHSLSKAERVAMFAFFKGVGQILTGEYSGKDAQAPGETPANVKMKKAGGEPGGSSPEARTEPSGSTSDVPVKAVRRQV
jgi:hypothetical protein